MGYVIYLLIANISLFFLKVYFYTYKINIKMKNKSNRNNK